MRQHHLNSRLFLSISVVPCLETAIHETYLVCIFFCHHRLSGNFWVEEGSCDAAARKRDTHSTNHPLSSHQTSLWYFSTASSDLLCTPLFHASKAVQLLSPSLPSWRVCLSTKGKAEPTQLCFCCYDFMWIIFRAATILTCSSSCWERNLCQGHCQRGMDISGVVDHTRHDSLHWFVSGFVTHSPFDLNL